MAPPSNPIADNGPKTNHGTSPIPQKSRRTCAQTTTGFFGFPRGMLIMGETRYRPIPGMPGRPSFASCLPSMPLPRPPRPPLKDSHHFASLGILLEERVPFLNAGAGPFCDALRGGCR